MIYFIFFVFIQVFKIRCTFYTYSAFQFGPVTFQVLSGLWLVAVVLDSTGLELTRKSQDIQGIQGTEKRVQ